MGKFDADSLRHAARVVRDFPYPAILEIGDEILASDGIIAETAVRREPRAAAVLISMTKCMSGDHDRTLGALERFFETDPDLQAAAEAYADKMRELGFRG